MGHGAGRKAQSAWRMEHGAWSVAQINERLKVYGVRLTAECVEHEVLSTEYIFMLNVS